MDIPRVCVIMACYNGERYLSATIESVLAQSYKNFHFIAGNDGSKDNTENILAEYAGKITIAHHPDRGNHGQAATYNLCLQEVNSEYIAFIDNDDLWHPDKLLKMVNAMDSLPDVGLMYSNGNVIDGNDRYLHYFLGKDHRETNDIGAILLDCYIRTPSAVMVRSETLRTAGIFTEGIIPDHDMWIRMKELAPFYYLNEKLFSYRAHAGQLSVTSTERMWRDEIGTLERAIARYHYPSCLRRQRLAVIYYRLGCCARLSNSTIAAGYNYIRSFFYDPLRAFKQIAVKFANISNMAR
jgi:glycosyltransferase involved in cell wall biosynthesis